MVKYEVSAGTSVVRAAYCFREPVFERLSSKRVALDFLFQRYSALIFGSRMDDLMIVSGTVFNKVLLWHVREESPGPKSCVCVRMSYTGHQVSP